MDQWNSTAKFFHWAILLLLVVTAGLGLLAESQVMSPAKLQLFVSHKSLGLTVLGLVLLRLLWRAASASPAALENISPVNRRIAAAGHATLYLLIIVLPLSGWLLSSAANFPFRWFGLLNVPMLGPPDKAVQELAEFAHHNLFYLLLVLVVGHAGIALWHARRGIPLLPRMFPARISPAWFLLLLALFAAAAIQLLRMQPVNDAAEVAILDLPARPVAIFQQQQQQQNAAAASAQVGENNRAAPQSANAPAIESPTSPANLLPIDQPATDMKAVKLTPADEAMPDSLRGDTQGKQPIAVASQPRRWAMQPEQSSLAFIGSYTGAEFTGYFTRFEPRIFFDPDNLQRASIEVEIDITSATLDSDDMDAMLPEQEWFHFARYPKAIFVASEFEPSGDGFVARGKLSLKGHVHPVTLQLNWDTLGPRSAQLRAVTTVSRVAFGIGSGEWAADSSIGFDVRIEAELVLHQQDISP